MIIIVVCSSNGRNNCNKKYLDDYARGNEINNIETLEEDYFGEITPHNLVSIKNKIARSNPQLKIIEDMTLEELKNNLPLEEEIEDILKTKNKIFKEFHSFFTSEIMKKRNRSIGDPEDFYYARVNEINNIEALKDCFQESASQNLNYFNEKIFRTYTCWEGVMLDITLEEIKKNFKFREKGINVIPKQQKNNTNLNKKGIIWKLIENEEQDSYQYTGDMEADLCTFVAKNDSYILLLNKIAVEVENSVEKKRLEIFKTKKSEIFIDDKELQTLIEDSEELKNLIKDDKRLQTLIKKFQLIGKIKLEYIKIFEYENDFYDCYCERDVDYYKFCYGNIDHLEKFDFRKYNFAQYKIKKPVHQKIIEDYSSAKEIATQKSQKEPSIKKPFSRFISNDKNKLLKESDH